MHAAIRCSEDRAVRAVLLSGAGRMFCVGGDLKSFAAQGERLSAHLKELAGMLHMAISRFVRMDAPLVVAVNGAAGGGGMSFVLAADLVLAAESAKFTMAYTRAGLSPDGGSTFSDGFAYNPGTDSWGPIAGMPLDLWASAAGAPNGLLVLSSGVTNGFSTVTNQGVAYDPGTDSWSSIPNAQFPRYRAGGSCGFFKVGGSSGGFSPTPATRRCRSAAS